MSAVRRSFFDDPGHGTFHSLGVLPIRKQRPPVFHFARDDDDDDSSLDERPSLARSTSFPPSPRPSPILLSNGKPLKSSLKSSPSSPAIQHLHLRARSEPSTPKHVHFPEEDCGLATVCVFNYRARPAALGNGNGDETGTMGEDIPPSRFPFPTVSPTVNYEIDPVTSSPVPSECHLSAHLFLESLNLSSSSFSPTSSSAKPLLTGSIIVRNLAFEKHVAVRFTLDDWQIVSEVSAHYAGSLPSLPPLMSPSSSAFAPGDITSQRGRGWDRFTFTIRLEHYAFSLSTRTIWLAARYRVTSAYPLPESVEYGPGGEWWDNNDGYNYRVGFRSATVAPKLPQNRPRRETVSASITSPRVQSPLPTASKEHALGLMIQTAPSNKVNQSVYETDRRSGPLRFGKLDLCNYAPPTVHATSSISFPSMDAPLGALVSLTTNSEPSSDRESASPMSSTLSTPSTSPTITPRVIIGGQPATYFESLNEADCKTSSAPVHIADSDWSTPIKVQIEQAARQCADPVPALGILPGSEKTLSHNSLHDAFVTHWCFAHGPSLAHHGYKEGGFIV